MPIILYKLLYYSISMLKNNRQWEIIELYVFFISAHIANIMELTQEDRPHLFLKKKEQEKQNHSSKLKILNP